MDELVLLLLCLVRSFSFRENGSVIFLGSLKGSNSGSRLLNGRIVIEFNRLNSRFLLLSYLVEGKELGSWQSFDALCLLISTAVNVELWVEVEHPIFTKIIKSFKN